MRAASDLHLAPHTAAWVFQALADLRADAKKFGGPTVLCGDIFDQSKVVDVPLFNRLRDELRAFPSIVVVIPGNHDQYNGWRNACEGLAGGNVIVVSQPAVIEDVGLCVPHTAASDWLGIVAQNEHLGHRPPLIFAHQGFKGSYLNNMVRDRTGIQVPAVNGRLIVSGHYHMPQNVAQVIYCGSPYQTSHAESGQVKGFLAWGDDTLRESWSHWLPERRPYPSVSAPRYWTVRWDGQGAPVLPAGHREGDIVRIVTTFTRDNLDAAAAKAIKKAGLSGASIVTAPSTSPRVDVYATTPVAALEEYLVAARKDGIDPSDLRDFMTTEGAWPVA